MSVPFHAVHTWHAHKTIGSILLDSECNPNIKFWCWQCVVCCNHHCTVILVHSAQPPRILWMMSFLMITYIALFSALLSRLTVLACGSTWVTSFIVRFLNIHRSGVLTALAWLVPHETAAVSAQVLCTPYNHAPCHFMQSHIRKVYACLAVTCHLHFWQNDRDLLHATVVTRGWNGYRNLSHVMQHTHSMHT